MTTTPPHLGEEYAPGTLGYAGFFAGLTLSAVSMAAGYIWALEGLVWQVYVAGTASWAGYLLAHYAVTGVVIDPIGEGAPEATDPTAGDPETFSVNDVGEALPTDRHTVAGFLLGIGLLVAGVGLLAVFVAETHLVGATLGAALLLGGYAIAHQFEAGVPL